MDNSQKIIILFSLLCFLVITGKVAFSQEDSPKSSDLKFSFALGYDNISENYYLVHIDTLGLPSESLETLKKATEETEEKKASLKLDLNKSFANGSKFSINNTLSLSNLYLRNILKIEWDKEWFFLNDQVELRKAQDRSQTSYQQDYFANNFEVGLKTGFSSDLTFKIRNSFELSNYKEKALYIYDYYLNKTSFELEKELASDGLFNLSYQFGKRYVPDSSCINYDRHLFDFMLEKYFGWTLLLQMENELERKTFKKPERVDDFWDNRFTFDVSYALEDQVRLKLKNEFELLSYDLEDEINFDYIENKFTPGLEYEVMDGIKLKGEPEWIIFSTVNNLYQEYDYNQVAFNLSLDISKSAKLWVSLEDKFGKRDYPQDPWDNSDENPFYTDYYLNQVTLFLDGELGARLRFNLMLSIDSEWHKSKEDNLTVFLLTSELVYSF
jgi:hypothetical protein